MFILKSFLKILSSLEITGASSIIDQ